MFVVVSFCNLRKPRLPLMGLVRWPSFEFEVLQPVDKLPPCIGITGLAASQRYLYAALQTGPLPESILVFDRADLRLVSQYMLRSATDVHSLCVSDDVLYAVSTGTDEVLSLQLRGPHIESETVFWRPDPFAPRTDLHHLNAIYELHGDLLVSGFGKKVGERWNSATDGFITNISRGETLTSGIYHPHSLLDVAGTIAYCESSRLVVRTVSDARVCQLPGYARGLCMIDDEVLVATSVGRRKSKSTGLINNPSESGVPAGRCTISRILAKDFQILKTIDLSPQGEEMEIYDLLPLTGVSDWPVTSKSNFYPFDLEREFAALIPEENCFILVDESQWGTEEVIAGRRRVPFTEKDGVYWGPPSDDATAIGELDRLRRAGANFIVFGWPAFWWLDYYSGFRQYLQSRFRCTLESDLLIVFDLRSVR